MADTLHDWARYVLGLVRRHDDTAELMVVGAEVLETPHDTYLVATVQGPPRTLMGVMVVQFPC